MAPLAGVDRLALRTSSALHAARKIGPQPSIRRGHGCTFCAGGPEENNAQAEFSKCGRNRLAEGKLPLCAEMCSTKALLAGDGKMVSNIYRERAVARGFGPGAWGWGKACPGRAGCWGGGPNVHSSNHRIRTTR